MAGDWIVFGVVAGCSFVVDCESIVSQYVSTNLRPGVRIQGFGLGGGGGGTMLVVYTAGVAGILSRCSITIVKC